MQRLTLWALLVCVIATAAAQSATRGYTIIVTDKESGTPVVTALAHVGNTYHKANEQGQIIIPTTALTADTLGVLALGYRRIRVKAAEVRSHQPLRIALTPHTNMLGEAAVEGKRVLHSKNVVTQTITARDVQKNLGNTFASALEQVKGVSMVQTGATIAKPVLHGMYGNRLLIVNNDVRQQGQQWGADHAPELDANAAGSLTVIKGAESVRYGAEALGGVIKLESKPLPYGRKALRGHVSGLYSTNGRRLAGTATLDAGLHLWGGQAAWRAQGTYINSGDRSTPHYILNNTGMREANASAALGWRNDRWGLEGYYSLFTTKIGVLYSAQMGDVELLKERIEIGQPVDVKPWTRHIDYPYQQVTHHTAKLKAFYRFDNGSRLQVQGAFQSDERNEYHQRRNFMSHIPSLSLVLNATQLDASWKHHYAEHWQTELGGHYAYVNNANKAGTGVVPIIPNYTQMNWAGYAIQKYSGDLWGAELGVRLERQRLSADGFNVYKMRYGGVRHYTNLAYTLGGHYHLTDHIDLLTNVGMSWRAPHVHELYSDGVEHATGVYLVGDSTLRPEKSTKWVTGVRYHDNRLTVTADVYFQWIKNYAFDAPTGEFKTAISGAYPIFQYRSTHAVFRGLDVEAKWKALSSLDYEVGGSMIWANEQKTGRYLPYIPSLRLTQSLQWRAGSIGHVHDIYVKANHKYVAKQTRFDAATDLIPYSPPAYHLFGAEVGASIGLKNGRQVLLLLSADNLFNKAYREYTNRFRYFAHDLGRDVRLMVTWEF